jgi:hypothetical protein
MIGGTTFIRLTLDFRREKDYRLLTPSPLFFPQR